MQRKLLKTQNCKQIGNHVYSVVRKPKKMKGIQKIKVLSRPKYYQNKNRV